MGDPCSVVAICGLAMFVFADLWQRFFIRAGIRFDGDICSHSTDSKGTPFMTHFYAGERVGTHERGSHRHLGAIRDNKLMPASKFLNIAEQIIPTATIQPAAMLAKFVKDLLHLKSRQNVLNQNSRLDAPLRNAQ